MATTKKTAAPEPEPQPSETESSEFVSFIKDGPTQDDLNPAYAAPKDEGADNSDDSA